MLCVCYSGCEVSADVTSFIMNNYFVLGFKWMSFVTDSYIMCTMHFLTNTCIYNITFLISYEFLKCFHIDLHVESSVLQLTLCQTVWAIWGHVSSLIRSPVLLLFPNPILYILAVGLKLKEFGFGLVLIQFNH